MKKSIEFHPKIISRIHVIGQLEISEKFHSHDHYFVLHKSNPQFTKEHSDTNERGWEE